jgi:hypothetical protein
VRPLSFTELIPPSLTRTIQSVKEIIFGVRYLSFIESIPSSFIRTSLPVNTPWDFWGAPSFIHRINSITPHSYEPIS